MLNAFRSAGAVAGSGQRPNTPLARQSSEYIESDLIHAKFNERFRACLTSSTGIRHRMQHSLTTLTTVTTRLQRHPSHKLSIGDPKLLLRLTDHTKSKTYMHNASRPGDITNTRLKASTHSHRRLMLSVNRFLVLKLFGTARRLP